MTEHKATGKEKGKSCHWEQKTSREVASQTGTETEKERESVVFIIVSRKGPIPAEVVDGSTNINEI